MSVLRRFCARQRWLKSGKGVDHIVFRRLASSPAVTNISSVDPTEALRFGKIPPTTDIFRKFEPP
jgi:hypothetical protein